MSSPQFSRPGAFSLAQSNYQPSGAEGDINALKGVNDHKTSYGYNADGSVHTVTEKTAGGSVIGVTTYTYDANGNVTSSVLVSGGQTVTTTYVYDASGNLTDTINVLS